MVKVLIGRRHENLHAGWDVNVVQALGRDPEAVAARLERQITPAETASWRKGTVEEWANETFGVAGREVYTSSLHTLYATLARKGYGYDCRSGERGVADNRIGSGQIQKPFGRAPLSGSSPREPDDPGSRGVSSSGNTLFASAFVVILIALIAGTGAFMASDRAAGFRHAVWDDIMGPPPEPAYQSRVASVCDKGWQDDRENRDQVDCYMTTDVERLCDPRERRALADKLLAYQVASDLAIGRVAVSVLLSFGKPGVLGMGMAEAKSRDPGLSEEQRAAQLAKVTGMAHDYLAPTEKPLEEGFANKHGIVTILNDVKGLAEQGYLAASDFPPTMPKIVKEGLAAAHSIAASSCKTR